MEEFSFIRIERCRCMLVARSNSGLKSNNDVAYLLHDERKKIPHIERGPLRGSQSPLQPLSERTLNPIKLEPTSAGWPT